MSISIFISLSLALYLSFFLSFFLPVFRSFYRSFFPSFYCICYFYRSVFRSFYMSLFSIVFFLFVLSFLFFSFFAFSFLLCLSFFLSCFLSHHVPALSQLLNPNSKAARMPQLEAEEPAKWSILSVLLPLCLFMSPKVKFVILCNYVILIHIYIYMNVSSNKSHGYFSSQLWKQCASEAAAKLPASTSNSRQRSRTLENTGKTRRRASHHSSRHPT